ncbi:MAG TPA: hypothetical protein VG820_10050 [Fimbriimonadaceae bacterium]|nr:hypothetical protein [Fimbriimonadaceae bacterium]
MASGVHLIDSSNKYKQAKVYVSPQLDATTLRHEYARADIQFHNVDHSEASYQALVFLNNEKATSETPTDDANGYAGSFYVFGHGGCFGDEGHCEVPATRRPYDPRLSHPLRKALKIVIATDAIRRATEKGKTFTITVVPIVTAATNRCNIDEVFHCEYIRVMAYR